ncbi:MAG: TolC family protein [Desulfobacterales bacterium]|jgi:outer membrane protein TolC|nr:TolC family protein [Desulfobacterales bacterium]
MDKVIENSFDVAIAEKDIQISEAGKRETLSLYYPAIKGKWNSEYIRDLTGSDGDLTSVGNSVFGEPTSYRNSYTLNAEWLLYDFGARANKLAFAEKDIAARSVARIQSIRDIKLKALQLYTELLHISRELAAKKTLLGFQKELFFASERLQQAGMLFKVDMVDDMLNTIKTVNTIDELQGKLQKTLHELSLFTREPYQGENIEIGDFTEINTGREPFSEEKVPESRIYELEIEKKQNELAILKKSWLPRFDFYSGYIWYGKDTGSYVHSIENIQDQNYIIGISASFSFFSGFKTRARIEKVNFEIEKLKLEKDKNLYELTKRYRTTDQSVTTLAEEITSRKEMIHKTTEKLSMAERLMVEKVTGQKEFLNQKIELANEQLALQQAEININSARIRLMLLSTGTH